MLALVDLRRGFHADLKPNLILDQAFARIPCRRCRHHDPSILATMRAPCPRFSLALAFGRPRCHPKCRLGATTAASPFETPAEEQRTIAKKADLQTKRCQQSSRKTGPTVAGMIGLLLLHQVVAQNARYGLDFAKWLKVVRCRYGLPPPWSYDSPPRLAWATP